MGCEKFLEFFDEHLKMDLSSEEEQEFCIWLERMANEERLTIANLLARAPGSISLKLTTEHKTNEHNHYGKELPKVLEGLIAEYNKD